MTSGKVINGILKRMVKDVTQLNNVIPSLMNDFKKDMTKEQLEEVNKAMEDADPQGKIQELKNKFDSIKSKL